MQTQPAEMLLHELLVHKIELEMQNEELQRTHAVIAESRDRYQDLYEFAPAGYIVVNSADQIDEINLTGAAMLGIVREQLYQSRFSSFVAGTDRDQWYRQFRQMMDAAEPKSLSFELAMLRSDGSVFHAHLACRRREFAEQQIMLLVFLSEIGEH